jgi:hypothetical protein
MKRAYEGNVKLLGNWQGDGAIDCEVSMNQVWLFGIQSAKESRTKSVIHEYEASEFGNAAVVPGQKYGSVLNREPISYRHHSRKSNIEVAQSPRLSEDEGLAQGEQLVPVNEDLSHETKFSNARLASVLPGTEGHQSATVSDHDD